LKAVATQTSRGRPAPRCIFEQDHPARSRRSHPAGGLAAKTIENLIYRRSGLLDVSGVSSDMRTLRQSRSPEAIALFVYRIVREIGSLAAALGGLDGLVFTAGIGEHDAATRAEVAAGCGWLGLKLDAARNTLGIGRISADGAPVSVWVVPTDEERIIARYTSQALVL